MMNEMTEGVEVTVTGIFPVPIYQTILNREFTTEEINFCNDLEKRKNDLNFTSSNNYILDEKPFAKLKDELFLRVENYFERIVTPKYNVSPYITQSWINWTDTNESHHMHAHSNSIISGVLYLNADKKYDSIKFHKHNNYQTLKFPTSNYHVFNSQSWTFPVHTGEIILFPSYLSHEVSQKIGDNLRTSLSFNTYVKGTIGEKMELTELIL